MIRTAARWIERIALGALVAAGAITQVVRTVRSIAGI
jgi:hypothetical protein